MKSNQKPSSSDQAREALVKLLDDSDKGLVLAAAQSLLHHAGLFRAMEETLSVEDIVDQELFEFFAWLRDTEVIPAGDYDQVAIIKQYWERNEDHSDDEG